MFWLHFDWLRFCCDLQSGQSMCLRLYVCVYLNSSDPCKDSSNLFETKVFKLKCFSHDLLNMSHSWLIKSLDSLTRVHLSQPPKAHCELMAHFTKATISCTPMPWLYYSVGYIVQQDLFCCSDVTFATWMRQAIVPALHVFRVVLLYMTLF